MKWTLNKDQRGRFHFVPISGHVLCLLIMLVQPLVT